MLNFRIRERHVRFLSGVSPSFPALATVSVALAPRAPFGGEAGTTRITAKGVAGKLRSSPSTGRMFFRCEEPLFESLQIAVTRGEHDFTVDGHKVTVKSRVGSLDEVNTLLCDLWYVFPAILSLEIPDSPYAMYAWGKVGEARFQWHLGSLDLVTKLKVTSKENQERYLVAAWEQMTNVRQNPRMFMSLHYFHTACRLLLVGQNRFEFMAEVVLNFAKCLQSLCGHSREAVRKTLADLGVSTEDAETLYVPAMIIRDGFDVAHVDLTQYSVDELRTLQRYVDIAEEAFRRLLKIAMELFARGAFIPGPTRASIPSREQRNSIARLEANLKRYADAAPAESVRTGVTTSPGKAFEIGRHRRLRQPPKS